jgi:hypothetical protein
MKGWVVYLPMIEWEIIEPKSLEDSSDDD